MSNPACLIPEPVERVESWQASYDLPYPLLADPEAEVVIVDRRGSEPEIAYVHQGRSTFDRPDIEELLAELGDLRDT